MRMPSAPIKPASRRPSHVSLSFVEPIVQGAIRQTGQQLLAPPKP
jgi:hypothetical protein